MTTPSKNDAAPVASGASVNDSSSLYDSRLPQLPRPVCDRDDCSWPAIGMPRLNLDQAQSKRGGQL